MGTPRNYSETPPARSQERIDAANARSDLKLRDQLVLEILKKEKAEALGAGYESLVAEYEAKIAKLTEALG